MLITLEIISANGNTLGPNRRKTVGPEGAQIGRGKENDWNLPGPYISRAHARIRYVNGAFYIEAIGRNPVAINDAQSTIANNDPQLLRSGDHVFLDEYEIKATVSAGNTVAPEDPFSTAPAVAPSVPEEWSDPSSLQGIEIRDGESQDEGNLDPLEALGGRVPRPTAPPKHVDLHQGSVLEDNYQAPKPIASPAGGQIPDRWDQSKFTLQEQPTAPPSRPPVRAPAAPADKRGAAPIKPSVPQTVRRTAPARASATEARKPPAMPPVEGRVQPATAVSESSSVSLEQLLRAAGVPATQMTPEMAAELGQVFRIVVQGLMEVLQSRAEIKSQLRMSMTRMKPTENNPLKFSPNVEAALHTLLVERNRGYLPTTRAFQEAFADVRDHQIAVLQGIRAAFDAMLEEFNPERIEEEMNHVSRGGGLLNVGVKARFRDFYVERFERLTGDRDESFRCLFGQHFAQAYQDQMDLLKAKARTSGG